MTNPYFNHDNPLSRHTLGRAERLNDIFVNIAEGFGKIPTIEQLQQGRFSYYEAAGTANALVVTMSPPITAYTAGLSVSVKIAEDNTGATTININGVGTVPLKRFDGQDLEAGDLKAGMVALIVHNGTQFRLASVHGADTLGTAAFRNATTSNTDTTAGRLLKVGDFGVGALGPSFTNFNDLNDGGLYGIAAASGALNTPNGGGEFYGGVIVLTRPDNPDRQAQIAYESFPGDAIYWRRQGATWEPWREIYTQGSILGTVSQAAGVPTGAVIERGSNANGAYVKFADGTILCYGSYTGAITVAGTALSGLSAGNITLTMPASSIVNWIVLAFSGNNQSSPNGWGGKADSASSGSSCGFRYYTLSSTVTATSIQWAVIGRWF